jgi:hypothetical protein
MILSKTIPKSWQGMTRKGGFGKAIPMALQKTAEVMEAVL